MSQNREVETLFKKIYMFEIGEDPRHPTHFVSTKVSSYYTILFSKLEFNSVEIRQQWYSTLTYITRQCVQLLILLVMLLDPD